MNPICIFGRDRRYELLEERLIREGYPILKGRLEESEPCTVILPFSFTEEKTLSLMNKMQPQSTVLLGNPTKAMDSLAKEKSLFLVPVLKDPSYRLRNALATAEGTLTQVIEKTDGLLSDLCILICGYGHCGSALARLFWLCGSEVWIHSREGSMKRASEDGFNLYPEWNAKAAMFDAVLNTVPDPIFPDPILRLLRSGSSFFQIASGLSGLSTEKMQDLGIDFHVLHGLPGQYAPASEAEALYRILTEPCRDSEESE